MKRQTKKQTRPAAPLPPAFEALAEVLAKIERRIRARQG